MSMLKLFIALLFLMSPFMLRAAEFDSPYIQSVYEDNGAVPIGVNECIPSSLVHMVVLRKVAEHSYQTASLLRVHNMYEEEIVARGVLTTTKNDFATEGHIDIKIRYRGVKIMKLESGFDAKFGVWEECK